MIKINRTRNLLIFKIQRVSCRPKKKSGANIFQDLRETGLQFLKTQRRAQKEITQAASLIWCEISCFIFFFSSWGKRAAHNRAQIVYYMAENLELRHSEFSERLCNMTGCSIQEANKEVDMTIQRLFYWGAYADKYGGTVQVKLIPVLQTVNRDNRPVSYSNGWTGSSMRWRLMRAN